MTSRRAAQPLRPGEAGSGTILMLLVTVVVLLVGLVMAAVSAVAVARQRAASAADLAALAGYAHALEGRARVCRAAEAVLLPVGAELVACAITDGVVEVSARVQPTGVLSQWGAATARARAGAADQS